MTSINPLLQTKITQQNAAQTSNKTPKIDLTQKPDKVEINSATNKKKIAKYVGIGIAIACTIAATAFLLTKGKTCLLEFNAKKAQKYAEDIKEKAERLQKEVVELFSANGMKNGNEVAKIIEDVDCKIMEEIDSSGALIRKSIFGLDGNLQEIELPAKKGVDEYFFKNGKLTRYLKNCQRDSKGNMSAAKLLFFENGKLAEYYKNRQVVSKKYGGVAKMLVFEDDKLIQYYKNSQLTPEGESTAKELFFEDGKLARYLKNYQYDSKRNRSIAKILSFEDGKLAGYAKNFQQDPERNRSIAKEIKFTPGKPLINLLEFLKSFKKDS